MGREEKLETEIGELHLRILELEGLFTRIAHTPDSDLRQSAPQIAVLWRELSRMQIGECRYCGDKRLSSKWRCACEIMKDL